jgi:hypothetical protein
MRFESWNDARDHVRQAVGSELCDGTVSELTSELTYEVDGELCLDADELARWTEAMR